MKKPTLAALKRENQQLRARLATITEAARDLLEARAREWDDHPELTKRLRGLIGEGR